MWFPSPLWDPGNTGVIFNISHIGKPYKASMCSTSFTALSYKIQHFTNF